MRGLHPNHFKTSQFADISVNINFVYQGILAIIIRKIEGNYRIDWLYFICINCRLILVVHRSTSLEELLSHRCNREELPTERTIKNNGRKSNTRFNEVRQICLRPWGKEERFLLLI